MPALKFTARQIEMIEHRLDVPECIAESFGCVAGVDVERIEAVEAGIERVRAAIRAGNAGDLDRFDAEILADCFCGSTWLAGAEQEFSPSVFGAMAKSFDLAAQKVADHFGISLEMPAEARRPYVEPTGTDPQDEAIDHQHHAQEPNQ